MNQITPFAFGTTPNFDSIIVDNFISGVNGGPLPLLADPVNDLDAATKQYVDVSFGESIPTASSTPPAAPINNQLWWSTTDGQLYIWYTDPNSSQWVIANNTGVQDAPTGTVTYGRQNGHWIPVLPLAGGTMTGPLVLHRDPTSYFEAATKGYVDLALQGYLPLTGGTVSGQLLLTQDPTVAHGAATKQYVDGHSGLVAVADAPPVNPDEGQLWFDSMGVQLYVWYIDGGNGVWVQTNAPAFTDGSAGAGGPGAGFPEAPVDGRIYGRDGRLQSWVPVMPLLGGASNAMAGPLFLANNAPVFDNEAASKRFVEDAVATGSLWQGGYTVSINSPDLTAVTPLNGYSWTAITQDPLVPELLTVNLPGIATGTLIYNGDLLRWDANNSLWFAIRGSGITRNEADALYVLRAGDLMTGMLYLAGDPTQPTEAATKRYADTKDVFVSNYPPQTPYNGQLWYDMANPNLYIWLEDPTSAQWVIAVNPTATTAALPFVADPFIFPDNPVNGETVTTPAGASYRWDAATTRWEYVPQHERFVNLSGDTMTGWLTIEGMENAAVKFQKQQIGPGPFFDGQWAIGADYTGTTLMGTGFKIVRLAPDGSVIDSPISISEMDSTITIGGEGINLNQKLLVGLPMPTIDSQAVPRIWAVAKGGDTMTGPLTINNASTAASLVINNTMGLGALEIYDNSNTHSVSITNTGGGAALIIDDNTLSTAVQISNSGAGSALTLRHLEGFGHAALDLVGGNRDGAGFGGNPQIALNCIGGGRSQWIASWTDVGGGGYNEAVGIYVNNRSGSAWPGNALFAGGFNSSDGATAKIVAPYGTVSSPGLVFGSGAMNGFGSTIDTGTGFYRPAANTIGIAINTQKLAQFDFTGLVFDHLNTGFWFPGGGAVWNRGTGNVVTIRSGPGNSQPQIEGNNGLNARDIIDTINGDARYVTKSGNSTISGGQLTLENPLRLYKNNTTINTNWPEIYFPVPSGRDAGANGIIRLRQTGPYSYYGTVCNFEFHTSRGGYGVQRAFWSTDGGGGWCNFNSQGDVYARGVILSSDQGMKEDITPLDPNKASEAIERVSPVRFKWKPLEVDAPLAAPDGVMRGPASGDIERYQYGLIADEVELILPEAVHINDDGKKCYDLGTLFAVMISELQNQQKKIKRLEARLVT